MFENINLLKKEILDSQKIVLINHIKMDWDAFWSLWALYLVLEKLGKNVKAINDFREPESFNFLLNKKIFEPDLDLNEFNPDLIISLDAASTWQLWETYKKFENIFNEKNFVVIDHHQTNPWFWKLNFVYPEFSSTCELLFLILKELDFENFIDKQIATLLITWIETDTNIFYNQNVTSTTFSVASELVNLWADYRTPIYNFYQKIEFKRLKLFWKAINNLKQTKNLVYSFLSKKDFEDCECTIEDTSGIVSKLSNIDENEAVCMIYENETWVKVSFRSKNFDVWSFCESFPGWGWHKYAAWFNLEKNIYEAEKIILERFEKFF